MLMDNLSKFAIKNSALSFIAGDAIGLPFEFETKEEIDGKIFDFIGFGTYNQPVGTWSDDTSMTLYTMKSIIDKKEISIKNISDLFLKWSDEDYLTATDECFDVGLTTSKALTRYACGIIPSGINDFQSNGNGSLMRILPISLYCYYKNITISETFKIIKEVSSITHAHPISILGCFLYTNVIFNILDKKDKYNCLDFNFIEYIPNDYANYIDDYEKIINNLFLDKKYEDLSSSGYVVDTLEVVLWNFYNNNNVEDCILKTANLGGDTDTNAAIAGSLSGLYYGLKEQAINKEWQNKVLKLNLILELIDKFIVELSN